MVFEGDESSGYSGYSPDVPGVVVAGGTRAEVETLMREALHAHLTLLRESGEAVPSPSTGLDAAVVAVPA